MKMSLGNRGGARGAMERAAVVQEEIAAEGKDFAPTIAELRAADEEQSAYEQKEARAWEAEVEWRKLEEFTGLRRGEITQLEITAISGDPVESAKATKKLIEAGLHISSGDTNNPDTPTSFRLPKQGSEGHVRSDAQFERSKRGPSHESRGNRDLTVTRNRIAERDINEAVAEHEAGAPNPVGPAVG